MKAGLAAGCLLAVLTGCGPSGVPVSPKAEPAATISPSLAPFGDGYPNPGDPCRRLGESAATVNFLDDSAILVGCPSEAAATALNGREVAIIEGIRLLSIPTGNANAGMPASEDALVPGTDYNATAEIPCGMEGAEPAQRCPSGVKRGWGEDGTTLVEVTKPDGRKRALFFNGATPYSADGAEADGSAAYSFKVDRKDDTSIIRYGPETYIVPDAFVLGG